MTKTIEPVRVKHILKESKGLIQKLKEAEENNMQRQMQYKVKKSNLNKGKSE